MSKQPKRKTRPHFYAKIVKILDGATPGEKVRISKALCLLYGVTSDHETKLATATGLILESQNLMAHRSGNSDVSMKLGMAHGLVLQVQEALFGKRLSNLEFIKQLKAQLTPGQRKLMKKHGTPAEFAKAVYKCVPGDISMEEAKAAVEKYGKEWEAA